MSPSLRRAATAFAATTAALAFAAPVAYADAPPTTCHQFDVQWTSPGDDIALDTVGNTSAEIVNAAACGIVATPVYGVGTFPTIGTGGDACVVSVTARTYSLVAYNLQHALSPYVSVIADTTCTAPVGFAQHVDAIVNGAVTSTVAGGSGTGTHARMYASFGASAVGGRQARYCVDITTAAGTRPACATTTPV
jgi:hypothetical protein